MMYLGKLNQRYAKKINVILIVSTLLCVADSFAESQLTFVAQEPAIMLIPKQNLKNLKQDIVSNDLLVPAVPDTRTIIVQHTSSASVARLDLKTIGQQAKKYRRQMQLHRCVELFVELGVPVFNLYQLYLLLNAQRGQPSANQSQQQTQPVGWVDWFKNGAKDTGQAICNFPDSWIRGGIATGKFIGNAAAVVGTNILLHKLANKFVHDHTIHWLISCHQTSYKKTLLELRHEIEELSEDPDNSFFDQSFISAHNTLVKQLEKIIAFVKYKNPSLEKDKKQEGKGIADYLIDQTNAFCDKLEALRAQSSVSLAAYLEHFNAFEMVLDRQVLHFSRIDPEQE